MTNSKSWQNPQRFFLGRHKLKEKAQRLQTNPNETLPEESKNKDFFQKFKLSLIFQFFSNFTSFLKCVCFFNFFSSKHFFFAAEAQPSFSQKNMSPNCLFSHKRKRARVRATTGKKIWKRSEKILHDYTAAINKLLEIWTKIN